MSVISRAALARLELSTDHYHDQNQQQAVQDKFKKGKRTGGGQRSARRRDEEEAETAADSPVRGKKGKGVQFSALRDAHVEESASKLSDREKEDLEQFYIQVAQAKQKSLTRNAFKNYFRRWFHVDQDRKKLHPMVDRLFSLLDGSGNNNNAVSHSEFQNFMAVFLRGSLKAQLFFTFQVFRIPPPGASAEEGVDTLTRDDLFKHIKLGTDSHDPLRHDFSTFLSIFEEKNENSPAETVEYITFEDYKERASASYLAQMFKGIITKKEFMQPAPRPDDMADDEDDGPAAALAYPRHAAISRKKQREYEEMFKLFDHDGDGVINKKDLMKAGACSSATARDVLWLQKCWSRVAIYFDEKFPKTKKNYAKSLKDVVPNLMQRLKEQMHFEKLKEQGKATDDDEKDDERQRLSPEFIGEKLGEKMGEKLNAKELGVLAEIIDKLREDVVKLAEESELLTFDEFLRLQIEAEIVRKQEEDELEKLALQ